MYAFKYITLTYYDVRYSSNRSLELEQSRLMHLTSQII